MKFLRIAMLVGALGGATALFPNDAHAALNSYLVLKGQKTGDIKAKSASGDGSVKVTAFSYEIISPRDAASGLPTGKRQHKPFTVTIPVEKDLTGILIGLLAEKETLEGTLVAKKKKGGAQVEYMTIKLSDCMVTSYRVETDAKGDDVIVLSLVYQKIEGKYADGTVFLSETVQAPKALAPNKPAMKPVTKTTAPVTTGQ